MIQISEKDLKQINNNFENNFSKEQERLQKKYGFSTKQLLCNLHFILMDRVTIENRNDDQDAQNTLFAKMLLL